MSFLKQNLDFLIEEPYDLEFKPLGYLTIVVVAVLAFFVFVPKGDKTQGRQETFAGLRDNH